MQKRRLLTLLATSALTQAGVRHDPLLRYVQIGSARIAFEPDTIVESGRRTVLQPSTFRSAHRVLGAAQPTDTGDAGGSYKWVCYRLAGTTAMSVILGSTEMGGGTYITDFSFMPSGMQPSLERRCSRSAITPAQVRTDRGLRLGLTRSQVDRLLGVAGRDSANVVVYERDTEKPYTTRDGKRETYTEAAGFIIQFRAGRTVGFSGWRLDST